MQLYGIVGAGGFGREVIPLAKIMLEKMSTYIQYELVFIDQNKKASSSNNYPILSMEEFFSHSAKEKFFNVAIAQPVIRRKVVEDMLARGAKPFRINAYNMVELDNNDIGDGAIFCPQTIVTSNAKIGKYFHANLYSYVAHDCIVGDFVTFAPSVHCNGNVIIEDDVYAGTGVIIREGRPDNPIIIGKGAVLGMGAVVTKSVPPYETVVGNPAKPFKKEVVSPQPIQKNDAKQKENYEH